MKLLRPTLAATKILLAFTLVLGLLYPLALTTLGRLIPGRTDGSVVVVDGRPAGSSLLGAATQDPQWFHARPSASDATGESSGGTNLAPSSSELASQVAERQAAEQAANPDASGPVPADALTASGSGLDPDISLTYARWQVPRVARATGLRPTDVEVLVNAHTDQPALGFLGTERVNVTELNAALANRLSK